MAAYAIWDKHSPEEFQRRLQYVLEGLGVKRIAANILVFGEGETVEGTIADHDTHLPEALQRARAKRVKILYCKVCRPCSECGVLWSPLQLYWFATKCRINKNDSEDAAIM